MNIVMRTTRTSRYHRRLWGGRRWNAVPTGRTDVSSVPWTVYVRPMQRTRRPLSQWPPPGWRLAMRGSRGDRPTERLGGTPRPTSFHILKQRCRAVLFQRIVTHPLETRKPQFPLGFQSNALVGYSGFEPLTSSMSTAEDTVADESGQEQTRADRAFCALADLFQILKPYQPSCVSLSCCKPRRHPPPGNRVTFAPAFWQAARLSCQRPRFSSGRQADCRQGDG